MSIGRFEIKNKHTKAKKKKKKPLSASYFLKEQTSFWQVTQPALPHLRGVAVNTTVSLVAVDRHCTYLCATTPALFNLSLFFGKEIQRRRRRRMGKKNKKKSGSAGVKKSLQMERRSFAYTHKSILEVSIFSSWVEKMK